MDNNIVINTNNITSAVNNINGDMFYDSTNNIVYTYTTTTNGFYQITDKEYIDSIINEKSKEKELRDKRINKLYEIFND